MQNPCHCCNGDEAVFWKDGENHAFVDATGNMLVSIDGKELTIPVKFCPVCGRAFSEEAPLRTGDDVYYAYDDGYIEHGIVASACYENGGLQSVGIEFPESNEFDEFSGEVLGTSLFRTYSEAERKVLSWRK